MIIGKTKLPDNPNIWQLQAVFEQTLFNRATYTMYCEALDKIVEFFGKERRPQDIYSGDVEAFQAEMTKQGYAPSTVRRYCIAGSSFFTWMSYYDIVDFYFNPFRPFRRLERTYTYKSKEGEVWSETVTRTSGRNWRGEEGAKN